MTQTTEAPTAVAETAAPDTLKFDVKQTDMIAALNIVGRAVPAKAFLPILNNVLLMAGNGGLTMRTTNLDMTIERTIEATVWTDGQTTVPHHVLADYVAQLDDKTNVSFDLPLPKSGASAQKVALSSGGYKANIATIAAADFPPIPEVNGITFSVASNVFRDVVQRTSLAAATDDTRPVLAGVLLHGMPGKLTLAAADGFRLAASTLEVDGVREQCYGIVPAKQLDAVSKLLPVSDKPVDITLGSAGGYARFETDDVKVVMRLISGQFPAYERIIPSEVKTSLTVSTLELTRAIRAAAVFARDNSNIVRLSVTNGGPLVVSSTSAMMGDNSTEVDAEVDGVDNEIAFNAVYVRELLDVVGTEKTVLSLVSASSPAVFRPVGDTNTQRLHVVMPMHVSQ